ncbi:MAG: GTP-binding protein, partial [Gallionella sp.]|nr:GTP-binding protein [Gallionella sp.]
MCGTCGCGGRDVLIGGKRPVRAKGGGALAFRAPGSGEGQAGHAHQAAELRVIQVERDLLAKNDAQADANRQMLAARGIFALNLVSSPGSGKTTLLVKTITALNGALPLAVIEGDQQTENDAAR